MSEHCIIKTMERHEQRKDGRDGLRRRNHVVCGAHKGKIHYDNSKKEINKDGLGLARIHVE